MRLGANERRRIVCITKETLHILYSLTLTEFSNFNFDCNTT